MNNVFLVFLDINVFLVLIVLIVRSTRRYKGYKSNKYIQQCGFYAFRGVGSGASFEGMYPGESTNAHDYKSCHASKGWLFMRENLAGCNLVAIETLKFTNERQKV